MKMRTSTSRPQDGTARLVAAPPVHDHIQQAQQPDNTAAKPTSRLRIGIVVPHIFMHQALLGQVIFSPGDLALQLADGLQVLGADVTLFTPGPVPSRVRTVTANLSYFEQELAGRGD